MGRKILSGLVVVLVSSAYLANASWLAPEPQGNPRLLAHSGVHTKALPPRHAEDKCSARRMAQPRHSYIENTLPSIRASFAAGADAVEIDIRETADGEFVVFHDDHLDCRTDGSGPVAAHTLDQLKTLDVGFGYTADGGKSYPLRGKGIGQMISLNEVLTANPDGDFLIDLKSEDAAMADRLVAYLKRHGHPTDERLWVWADGDADARLRRLAPEAHILSSRRAKTCVWQYLAIGWTGIVPNSCHGTSVLVPSDVRWIYWGWPNRFLDRMEKVGAEVLLSGRFNEREPGMSNAWELQGVPSGFSGIIVTDQIEKLGPIVRREWPAREPEEQESAARFIVS